MYKVYKGENYTYGWALRRVYRSTIVHDLLQTILSRRHDDDLPRSLSLQMKKQKQKSVQNMEFLRVYLLSNDVDSTYHVFMRSQHSARCSYLEWICSRNGMRLSLQEPLWWQAQMQQKPLKSHAIWLTWHRWETIQECSNLELLYKNKAPAVIKTLWLKWTKISHSSQICTTQYSYSKNRRNNSFNTFDEYSYFTKGRRLYGKTKTLKRNTTPLNFFDAHSSLADNFLVYSIDGISSGVKSASTLQSVKVNFTQHRTNTL